MQQNIAQRKTHTHTHSHARNTQNTSEIESEGKMTGLFHSINGIYHAMETGKWNNEKRLTIDLSVSSALVQLSKSK